MKLIENPVSVQDEKNIILIQFELLKYSFSRKNRL